MCGRNCAVSVAVANADLVIDVLQRTCRRSRRKTPGENRPDCMGGSKRGAPAIRFPELIALTAAARKMIPVSENCACSPT